MSTVVMCIPTWWLVEISMPGSWRCLRHSPMVSEHAIHDDVIKWEHFPRNWPFVRGIHRSPVNSPHIGQWRGALMVSLICVWINDWVDNREAGDLRRYRAHYGVIVMTPQELCTRFRLALESLCGGNPPVTGGFPSQRDSNMQNISIRWCHHDYALDSGFVVVR